jgi:hypothetical protein
VVVLFGANITHTYSPAFFFELALYSLTSRRDKFLKLDATAHEALQIFQVDKHPSYMGIGRAKEG